MSAIPAWAYLMHGLEDLATEIYAIIGWE